MSTVRMFIQAARCGWYIFRRSRQLLKQGNKAIFIRVFVFPVDLDDEGTESDGEGIIRWDNASELGPEQETE
jgi:hypothetical protein